MKVLGLNFGRDKMQCDSYLVEALAGAEKAGAEIEQINMCKLKINRCKGCGACTSAVAHGRKNRSICIIKDDFQEIMDKILDADAVIVAAPVYVLAPVGQFKDFLDRMGPANDKVVMFHENEKRLAENRELLDPRVLGQKYIAYISVGGARVQHWVSFGLSTMQIFGFPMQMKVVDQLDIYGAYASADRAKMFKARALELGQNVANAIGQDPQSLVWPAEPGACPICHGNHLTVLTDDSTKVECPICGIWGDLSIVDGEIKVEFSSDQMKRSRLNPAGLEEHYVELHVVNDLHGLQGGNK